MGLAELLDERERVRVQPARASVGDEPAPPRRAGLALLVSQLCDMRADMDGKLFLAAQAMDEARHIEVLRRYLVESGLSRRSTPT